MSHMTYGIDISDDLELFEHLPERAEDGICIFVHGMLCFFRRPDRCCERIALSYAQAHLHAMPCNPPAKEFLTLR